MEPLHHRLQAAGRTLTGLSVWSVVAERPPCSQGFPSGPLWLRRVLRPGVSRWLGFDGPHVARRTEAIPVSTPSLAWRPVWAGRDCWSSRDLLGTTSDAGKGRIG